MGHFQRTIVGRIVAFLPLAISIWAVSIVLGLLSHTGRPLITGLAGAFRGAFPGLTEAMTRSVVSDALAVAVTIISFYLLGLLVNAMIGRKLLDILDATARNVPIVQTVYHATRKLLGSFEADKGGNQRVVLIEFPSPEMKAVGLVTRTFNDPGTGEEIAAVYVPTTPNPTSGFMELVPASRLVWLDWSVSDAMQFIISGGTTAPDAIRFHGP